MRLSPALLSLALLAGCLQPTGPATGPGGPAAAADLGFRFSAQGCDGYLLGLVVDPANTDKVLPPGFHLRDPADFFREVPTATGQALVVLAATLCAGATVANATVPAFQEAFAGIFVQPPAVEGARPVATYDFYETDHLAADAALRHALAAWRWPAAPANLSATPVTVQGQHEQFSVQAFGSRFLFRFGGATPLPRDDGDTLVRFWRDAPAGLGRLDYHLPLSFSFGPGTCALGDLHAAAVAGGGCPPPLVAARHAFGYSANATLEVGRHAL